MARESAEEIADIIVKELINFFGDRIDSICVKNIINEPSSHKSFYILFKAYDYFPISLSYDIGRLACLITIGEYKGILRNSQKWWDTDDLQVFFQDLKEEIELRIPDKFLEKKGW